MFLALLTFVTGIAISIVAIYYSVLGLAAIFAAAVIPIVIMGTTLEISKLVTAWWLKANWHRAPLMIKLYLLPAVIMLMLITSMGIFGFLSKAHTDQAVPLGDTASQVAFIDEKINNERATIEDARRLLKQLDDAVIGIQSGEGREIRNRDGTTRIENPAERALQVRRSQARDRAALTQTINDSQARIVQLQEEKAPIASQLRAVEAEVGPIKYIAKLIYGDNPDSNLLEKAVVWVIIIIVLVFDPLAVLLLLASQMSFQWAKQDRMERKDELVQETTPPEDSGKETPPTSQPDSGTDDAGSTEKISGEQESGPETEFVEIKRNFPEPEDVGYTQGPWPFPYNEEKDINDINAELAELGNEVDIDRIIEEIEEEKKQEEKSALDDWNRMIEEAEKAAEQEKEIDDEKFLEEEENEEIKAAMRAWKHDHPETSLKLQRRLFEKGIIDKLPWEDYIKAEADFIEDEAAEEAAKWAQEQIESKKKDRKLDGESSGPTNQENQRGIIGYVQNAEQNDSTIWQRVKKAKE